MRLKRKREEAPTADEGVTQVPDPVEPADLEEPTAGAESELPESRELPEGDELPVDDELEDLEGAEREAHELLERRRDRAAGRPGGQGETRVAGRGGALRPGAGRAGGAGCDGAVGGRGVGAPVCARATSSWPRDLEAERERAEEGERAGTELEGQVATARSEAEEWVAGVRESHEQLTRDLEAEREARPGLEAQLEGAG